MQGGRQLREARGRLHVRENVAAATSRLLDQVHPGSRQGDPDLNKEEHMPETLETRIGTLNFESGYPSQETVAKLYDEMDFQRACQAYIWGIPAVGLAQWRLAHRDVFKARNGEMLSYLNFAEKLGILTPNYTTPYIATLVDLEASGPLVNEIPPGLMAGMILDVWQRVLADLGVVGPDQGKGGKYLILSPWNMSW